MSGGGAGGRYALPRPGAELVEDDRATLRVFHPTANQVEEEVEDAEAGGGKGAARAASAAALLRTLEDEQWERFRVRAKARAPHAVLRTEQSL